VTTPPRVLIVDDDPMNRDILQTLLASQRFVILTAVDGEEGLAVAREQHPDLILLDVMMPKMDGIEVCRRLRSDPALPFTPIIMVTARGDSKDIVAGLEVGADEYLTKPVDPDALVARVKSMLRIKALHDTVQGQASQLAEWNRTLEGRVQEQVASIESLGRRERTASNLYEVTSQLASNLDVDRVLDLITVKTIEFLGGDAAGLYTYDEARGGLTFHRGIHLDPELTRNLILTPGEGVAGRAFQERRPVWTRDRLTDPALQYRPEADTLIHAKAPRAYLAVPILARGKLYGVLVDYFFEPHDFTPEEIQLLSTLADHAAIALEKIDQFQQISTHSIELAHRVEQLGALNEIGQVVSSTLDLDRLLRTIVARAAQLAGADAAVVTEYDEPSEEFRPRATHGFEGEIVDAFACTPLRKGQGAIGRLADTHEPVQVLDIAPPDAYQSGLRPLLTQFGYRALLAVPLVCDDRLVGGLVISRKTPGAFAADIVELMTTFATQSALAIQNARLYGETTRREQEATKLYEITSQLASNLDVDRVVDLITSKTIDLLGCDASGLYTYDEARGGLTFHRGIHLDPELTRGLVLIPGEGVAGRAFQERRPVWTADRLADPMLQYTSTADILIQTKAPRAYMAVPILSRSEVYGVLVGYFFEPHGFAPKEVQLLSTLADHAAIAIENIRLLQEIRAKSRELELASQHKSEFLANMSHELRTPLNAILGFSEVLGERMFGELNEKQEEYLKDIHASGQHLLSLINDILDLSKIEAGRMELELLDFNLPATLDNALTLIRERAARRGIALQTNVDDRIDQIRADERKIRQILLNLLSNAIKFTPEGGRIEVGAVPKDGFVEVSISDTGVGIAAEDQDTVFEEFRQVGTADKKAEGTGLGLTLCRKFVEMHGGEIWVKSQVGAGSTFTFTLPLTIGQPRPAG
jgi:signal transduction histidine kinase/DNA-binding response OmpR family regulator